MTYTYALLDVSGPTYDEIAAKLRAAEYDHAFHEDGAIDMHGIALVRVTQKENAMADVFEGNPDARQSARVNHPVSRFRSTYRALTDDERALHDEIKTKASELEMLYAKVKGGRYNALAITSLEQSVMWVVKELTS